MRGKMSLTSLSCVYGKILFVIFHTPIAILLTSIRHTIATIPARLIIVIIRGATISMIILETYVTVFGNDIDHIKQSLSLGYTDLYGVLGRSHCNASYDNSVTYGHLNGAVLSEDLIHV